MCQKLDEYFSNRLGPPEYITIWSSYPFYAQKEWGPVYIHRLLVIKQINEIGLLSITLD